ncbi:MAG: DUF2326 domain-containing protein [Lactobacillus sp.]|nr:DUF2326 domain-containing protein [Lactobacillus sp.]
MFINSLEIISSGHIQRHVEFHSGVNLIVDVTPQTAITEGVKTGNGVGKTTVLRLIGFCFGKKPQSIYTDPESNKVLKDVKAYLTNNRVLIRLILSQNSTAIDNGSKYVLERNFLTGKDKIQRINGKNIANIKDLPKIIGKDLLGIDPDDKPSFAQITGRTFRIDSPAIDNTLKFVSGYTSNTEYETLFLFLFGVKLPDRSPVVKQLGTETAFLKRIETTPKAQLELELNRADDDIKRAQQQRQQLNLDPEYDAKISQLDDLKYQQTVRSNRLTATKLRLSLVKDAQRQVEDSKSLVDVKELQLLYSEAAEMVNGLQASFEQLVAYNNQMIQARVQFIGKEIPQLEAKIAHEQAEMMQLKQQAQQIVDSISNSSTSKDLEEIADKLAALHEQKGELTEKLSQVDGAYEKIEALQAQLHKIDNSAFSKEVQDQIQSQLTKFNDHFSKISEAMYGESYGVAFKKESDAKKNNYYKFYVFSFNNSSTGKKQGEIAAFDLGYIQFARSEKIPVLDFVLYDRKELMYGDQLTKISEIAKANDIQVVFPILSDKIPRPLDTGENIVLSLSQKNKLFEF